MLLSFAILSLKNVQNTTGVVYIFINIFGFLLYLHKTLNPDVIIYNIDRYIFSLEYTNGPETYIYIFIYFGGDKYRRKKIKKGEQIHNKNHCHYINPEKCA